MSTASLLSLVASGRPEPGGIVVLDSIPPERAPQLQPFVWCRHHGNQLPLKGGAGTRPLPGSLMVGLFRAALGVEVGEDP